VNVKPPGPGTRRDLISGLSQVRSVVTDRAHRRRDLAGFALGMSGWAFAGIVWVVGWQIGKFHLSTDITDIFLPAGRAFWSGANPYADGVAPAGLPFLYAPPWAALFGLIAPLGPGLIYALLIVLELLSLRYIAGSWVRAGAFCWFLLVPWEILSGQLNLLAAAAITAAALGRPGPAAIMAFAKVSPVLAVSPRDWRPFLIAVVVFSALSLPDPMAWVWWIQRLVTTLAAPVGPLVPVPFLLRLPVGLAFVAWGRPWSRALGAAIATPGLYWGALVVLVAPLGVALRPDVRRPDGDRLDGDHGVAAAADSALGQQER
jgi:hypothetical protein